VGAGSFFVRKKGASQGMTGEAGWFFSFVFRLDILIKILCFEKRAAVFS
jgi:hypothetical protein